MPLVNSFPYARQNLQTTNSDFWPKTSRALARAISQTHLLEQSYDIGELAQTFNTMSWTSLSIVSGFSGTEQAPADNKICARPVS